MKTLKSTIVAVCMLPLFAQAMPLSKGFVGSKSLMGSESGGGGKSSARTATSVADIQSTIETIHGFAQYHFNFVAREIPRDWPVIEKIEKAVARDAQFFKKLQLVTKASGSCEYADGRKSMATYSRGVICFNLNAIADMNYSQAEAEVKLVALYMHEVGHAAGYGSSKQDEDLLEEYQAGVEKLLNYTGLDLSYRYWNPLGDSNLGETLAELQKVSLEKRSLLWTCSKLQKVVEAAFDLTQQSAGLSFITKNQEGHLRLLIEEGNVLAGINCDGYSWYEDFLRQLRETDMREWSLDTATSESEGRTGEFCDDDVSDEEADEICLQARRTLVKTKPQALAPFRKDVGNLAGKMLKFLKKL